MRQSALYNTLQVRQKHPVNTL